MIGAPANSESCNKRLSNSAIISNLFPFWGIGRARTFMPANTEAVDFGNPTGWSTLWLLATIDPYVHILKFTSNHFKPIPFINCIPPMFPTAEQLQVRIVLSSILTSHGQKNPFIAGVQISLTINTISIYAGLYGSSGKLHSIYQHLSSTWALHCHAVTWYTSRLVSLQCKPLDLPFLAASHNRVVVRALEGYYHYKNYSGSALQEELRISRFGNFDVLNWPIVRRRIARNMMETWTTTSIFNRMHYFQNFMWWNL